MEWLCRLRFKNSAITDMAGTTWTNSGTNFVDIDHTDINAIKTNGISASSLNTITREQWDTLTVGKPGIGFAYLLTIEEVTDTCSIADISITADMKGSWRMPMPGTDYFYEYPLNDVLRINLNTDGSYKINYKE